VVRKLFNLRPEPKPESGCNATPDSKPVPVEAAAPVLVRPPERAPAPEAEAEALLKQIQK
jgi:hypothetical protein